MKKHNMFRNSLIAASMLLVPAMSFAQTSSSIYFLEGSSQRYQLNPAFEPERSVFIAVPALSNLNVSGQGSVGLSHFLFDSKSKPGMLTTFMSPDISYNQFMNALPEAVGVNLGVNMDLLALGFRGKSGYTSFNMKLRNADNASIPKELFGFMKSGLSSGDYMIKNTNINSITYLEAALTHSHKITDNLSVGASLKFLAGVEYVDVTINEIDARLSDDSWKVKTNASVITSLPGVSFSYNSEDGTLEGYNEYNFRIPSSYGFAVDLGASYEFGGLLDGLKVSASLTDLGMVNWSNVVAFGTDNNEYITFSGFNDYDVTSDDEEVSLLDDLTDDFKEMIKLYQTEDGGKKNVALNATMRLGAEYELPFLPMLSVGELMTFRTGMWKYMESRTSLSLTPCRWLALSGNAGFSSMGSVYGFVADIHPRTLNFFVAVDNLKARVNPQFIPLDDFGLNLSVGINLAFGKRRIDE